MSIIFKLLFIVLIAITFIGSYSYADEYENVNIVAWPIGLVDGKPNSHSTSIVNDFAEEFFDYISKDKKEKLVYKPMAMPDLCEAMSNGTVDILIPETILRGIKYCVEYDFVPWGMVVPSSELTNEFCRYIAISRKGVLNNINDISNTTWCIAGKYADVDFFATCRKLKKLLKITDLSKQINFYHIFDTKSGFMIPGKRHSMIQSVLIHDADWAIIPEYDFRSYISLFPAVANKLQEVKWLSSKVKLPGFMVLCKRSSLEKLEEYRDFALRLHTSPGGNQFIISSGFERFCTVPNIEFNQLTNWYKYLPKTDKFNLSK